MKAIGGHVGAIAGVVRGEVSYVGHVAAHARRINATSELMVGLFPAGTSRLEFAKTRARAPIWSGTWAIAVSATRRATGSMPWTRRVGWPEP